VAIIGILASIAIPAYQDYTIRAQITEGYNLASASKTAVEEFYTNTGRFPSNNASAGVASPASISGKYVTSVTLTTGGAGGLVTIMFGNEANVAINGMTAVLTASGGPAMGSVLWDCRTGNTVAPKYRPSSCR
jgi:type IV pilus assembly protein PilA